MGKLKIIVEKSNENCFDAEINDYLEFNLVNDNCEMTSTNRYDAVSEIHFFGEGKTKIEALENLRRILDTIMNDLYAVKSDITLEIMKETNNELNDR